MTPANIKNVPGSRAVQPGASFKSTALDVPAIQTSKGGVALRVPLPREVDVNPQQVAQDGTLVYTSRNAGTLVATQLIEDGSVRVHTILPNASAPRRYTYPLDLPSGATLRALEDGSIAVVDSSNKLIAGVAAPWARDADGNHVATRYEIAGTSFVQVVDPTTKTRYPVVADPWMGTDLYSRVYLSWHPQGWRVNATPSAWGVLMNGVGTYWAHKDEVRTRVGSAYYTRTIDSQHECHLLGWAFAFPEYNLESWSPYVAPAWSLARYRCNP